MAHKILAIDDEEGFTKLLKMNLEKAGDYEVCVENDSNKALATALEFGPDVVLLDIVMPGLDGGDVAAQFKSVPELKDIPVIMMTALVSQAETSDDAVAMAGSDLVLPKPVRLETLKRCLDEALGIEAA